MLKLSVAIFAIALASTASAAGWRSLRIDASSAEAFDVSVAALKQKLPRVHKAVLERSLEDIWLHGVHAAAAENRDYTIDEYFRQIDELGYAEIVRVTDPSGDTADRYFDSAYANLYRAPSQRLASRSALSLGRRGLPVVHSSSGPKLGAASQAHWY